MPPFTRTLTRLALFGLCLALLLIGGRLMSGTSTARAALSWNPQCSNPSAPNRRDPANPLMLPRKPRRGDPLQGAHFFIPGPARGDAAGAIAQLLGYGVGESIGSGQPLGGFSDSVSWSAFSHTVAQRLPRLSAGVRQKIALLEKIAREPQALRISSFSAGGSPEAVYSQTRKLFCTVLKADPHTIPIITTYFLHPELGGQATVAQIDADASTFRAQIDAMAHAIGNRPAALFLELDFTGSSSGMARRGSIGAWEALGRFEADTFEALPHTVVYLEGGYSDSGTPAYAARVLNASGIRGIQGFFTNDTHIQWTSHELAYARAVSARTGNAHFVINTSINGRGPLLNPHPVTQGVEDLCNPPNRGLGIPDTTQPGLDPRLDALLWVTPPGNSSGTCHGGTPSGTFWTARAISLAAHANLQLGPGYPSRPY